MQKIEISPKILFADLHLHLGGAINPRILWHRVIEIERNHDLLDKFKDYEAFESFFTKKKRGLQGYLKMFDVTEPLQNTPERLKYYIKRLMRGVFVFENLSYLELRYCPFSRTRGSSEEERIGQMRGIIELIDETVKEYSKYYPVVIKQILCMHSKKEPYSPNVNSAILDLAIEYKDSIVCGLDIAGGEKNYDWRFNEIFNNFKRAHENGLKTTAHIFETKDTPAKCAKLLPYLNRIGHGIQIPLKHPYYLDDLKDLGICLEICPTTYIKCGTFGHYIELRPIFESCLKSGVDVTLCTDNSGMHMVRLQDEYERLLIHHVVDFEQLNTMRANAFKHAFGLTQSDKDDFMTRMFY
jgi:adenosine deaminase